MRDYLNLSRAFGKYVLYLFTSLLVATVIGFFLGGDPEPRTSERLVLVVAFFRNADSEITAIGRRRCALHRSGMTM